DFEGDYGGAVGVHCAFSLQDFGEVAAFHVLHSDEEVAIGVTDVVDLHHARIERAHLLLDYGAAAFGIHHHLIGRVAAGLHELERSPAILFGIDREVHVGHAAADLAHDFVSADP